MFPAVNVPVKTLTPATERLAPIFTERATPKPPLVRINDPLDTLEESVVLLNVTIPALFMSPKSPNPPVIVTAPVVGVVLGVADVMETFPDAVTEASVEAPVTLFVPVMKTFEPNRAVRDTEIPELILNAPEFKAVVSEESVVMTVPAKVAVDDVEDKVRFDPTNALPPTLNVAEIPAPPVTIKAPFVGRDESVAFVSETIPAMDADDVPVKVPVTERFLAIDIPPDNETAVVEVDDNVTVPATDRSESNEVIPPT